MKDIHEECGVFGIYATSAYAVVKDVYYGLYTLQHRGQESVGITVNDDGIFYSHKDVGVLSEVFDDEVLDGYPDGSMAIGHVRYSTTGADLRKNAQPMEVNHQKGRLALAHNGNISNASFLRSSLENKGAIFHTTSDTEIIAYIVTRERLREPSIEKAVLKTMDHIEGAYSLVMMSPAKMIAVRDPYGFRPLCYGVTAGGDYVVASESCALETVGATLIRDIYPGEVIVFSPDGIKSYTDHCDKKRQHTCIFEYIYFARPDSCIDGIYVHDARIKAGGILADEDDTEADIVVGVPDSGLDAALGYAEASGIPYGIGLVKNKYIGRTFISPTQDERINGVKIKLNPIRSTVEKKRVILIDDSIVRGTTSAHIVKLLRDAGAKEIHMRISAPPFLNPCYYGTDIDSKENLIAVGHSTDEIADMIGADSLSYLPVERLNELTCDVGYCDACFSGRYATPIPKSMEKSRFEKRLSDVRG